MNLRSHLGMLLLLVAVIGWFAVVKPQMTTYSENTLNYKVKATELDSYNQRITDLKTIQEGANSVQKILKDMYLAMPKASQIPEVLVMIESISGSSGVVLNGINVGTVTASSATTAGAVSQVPVSVSFSGSLTSVTSFLDAVYNNIRTATVNSQTMSADQNGNLSVTMQLGIVYQGGN